MKKFYAFKTVTQGVKVLTVVMLIMLTAVSGLWANVTQTNDQGDSAQPMISTFESDDAG